MKALGAPRVEGVLELEHIEARQVQKSARHAMSCISRQLRAVDFNKSIRAGLLQQKSDACYYSHVLLIPSLSRVCGTIYAAALTDAGPGNPSDSQRIRDSTTYRPRRPSERSPAP